jgi:formylglycine-generating enzyme required for sulfatase activity
MAMGGNVQEWTRDSATPYTSTCWRAATLHDPTCTDDDAPTASIRGGCWMSNGYESVANRNQLPVAMAARGSPNTGPIPIAGFRCVYREAPR